MEIRTIRKGWHCMSSCSPFLALFQKILEQNIILPQGVIISVLSDGTSPDGIMSASLTTTLVSKLLQLHGHASFCNFMEMQAF
jgi:hypothetical protein